MLDVPLYTHIHLYNIIAGLDTAEYLSVPLCQYLYSPHMLRVLGIAKEIC